MKTPIKQDLKYFTRQTQQTQLSNQPPTVALPGTTITGTSPDMGGNQANHAIEPSFELVLEAIRQRQETKTAILQEALQRSEWAQQRFWGINE